MDDDIKKLIKQANNAEFHPSQIAFAKAATDFVHHSPPEKVKPKKYYTSGRYKRHVERKARGVKAGFGKSYSAPELVFRVEFSWVDSEGDESNEQVHWVKCRKLQGKEYRFIKDYFSREKECWNSGETVESEFVLRYVAHWLILRGQMADGRWRDDLTQLGYSKSEIPDLKDYGWGYHHEEGTSLVYPYRIPSTKSSIEPSALCPLPSAFMLNQAFIFPAPKVGNETIRSPLYEVRWTSELAEYKMHEDLAIVLKKSIWHEY